MNRIPLKVWRYFELWLERKVVRVGDRGNTP